MLFLHTIGYGPLDQTHLPEEVEFFDLLEYATDSIFSAEVKHEREVRYKVHWISYEPKNDTWLRRSAIPDNCFKSLSVQNRP